MNKIILLLFLLNTVLLVACGQEDRKMSDQEKAEKFTEQMKPIMEERIHTDDYNNFVKQINFIEDSVEVTPLGNISIDGTINNNDSLGFTFTLTYSNKNNIQSYSYDDLLAKKMGNFDKDKMDPLPSNESTSNEKYPGTSLKSMRKSI